MVSNSSLMENLPWENQKYETKLLKQPPGCFNDKALKNDLKICKISKSALKTFLCILGMISDNLLCNLTLGNVNLYTF